jgi:NADPH:quinone reductase-like Zn-dependent oxidoreductase
MPSATMRAVRLRAPGGPEQLVNEELPTPRPEPGQALVRVHAAGLTRDELEWPVDRLPAIPSYELSGVVEATGDSVFALTDFERDGVAADYALVSTELLAPKPGTVTDVEAAAIPLPALSAWQGLFDHGRLAEGERVMIHGASGGVGQFATQLACERGAYVIATVSSGDVERARALGADEVIDHTAERFEEVVEPVDLVFDTAGGDRLVRSPAVLRPGGRLVSVAEEPPRAADFGHIAVYFVVEPNREQLGQISELVDSGRLEVQVDQTFPLDDARRAFERLAGRGKRGKVVLDVLGSAPSGA